MGPARKHTDNFLCTGFLKSFLFCFPNPKRQPYWDSTRIELAGAKRLLAKKHLMACCKLNGRATCRVCCQVPCGRGTVCPAQRRPPANHSHLHSPIWLHLHTSSFLENLHTWTSWQSHHDTPGSWPYQQRGAPTLHRFPRWVCRERPSLPSKALLALGAQSPAKAGGKRDI